MRGWGVTNPLPQSRCCAIFCAGPDFAHSGGTVFVSGVRFKGWVHASAPRHRHRHADAAVHRTHSGRPSGLVGDEPAVLSRLHQRGRDPLDGAAAGRRPRDAARHLRPPGRRVHRRRRGHGPAVVRGRAPRAVRPHGPAARLRGDPVRQLGHGGRQAGVRRVPRAAGDQRGRGRLARSRTARGSSRAPSSTTTFPGAGWARDYLAHDIRIAPGRGCTAASAWRARW